MAAQGSRVKAQAGRFVFEAESASVAVPSDCCACCMGEADQLVEVPPYLEGQETGGGSEFPFCAPCVAHQRGHTRNWILGLIPGGLVTGAILWRGGFPTMPAGQTFFAFILGGLVVFAAKVVLSSILPGKGPRCSAEAIIVVCMGPLAGGRYSFSFSNRRFAEKFAQMNSGPARV